MHNINTNRISFSHNEALVLEKVLAKLLLAHVRIAADRNHPLTPDTIKIDKLIKRLNRFNNNMAKKATQKQIIRKPSAKPHVRPSIKPKIKVK